MLSCTLQIFYSLMDTALLLTWLIISIKIMLKELQIDIFGALLAMQKFGKYVFKTGLKMDIFIYFPWTNNLIDLLFTPFHVKFK